MIINHRLSLLVCLMLLLKIDTIQSFIDKPTDILFHIHDFIQALIHMRDQLVATQMNPIFECISSPKVVIPATIAYIVFVIKPFYDQEHQEWLIIKNATANTSTDIAITPHKEILLSKRPIIRHLYLLTKHPPHR